MGDAEGLVQVEVADVGADEAGAGEADLGVHVGAVHVDLAAGVVDHLDDVLDAGLELAVGGRVGDHERAEAVLVLGDLGGEVGVVDVAVVLVGDGDDLEAGAHGGGGVGAVGAIGDQADVAVALADGAEVLADDDEAGVFARGAGVGLQRDGGEAGDLGEPGLEIAEHLLVALGLLGGGEGMDLAELGPGDGDHLAGRVELHRARAQRDHGVGEAEVAALELEDVAEIGRQY